MARLEVARVAGEEEFLDRIDCRIPYDEAPRRANERTRVTSQWP